MCKSLLHKFIYVTFQLSAESDQAIALGLVSVLLRFEIG